MLYKKPAELQYTDLCIYIDQHIADIATPKAHTDIEDTVYNYLWLLVKALAIKKRMFQKFEDYDGYAFYAATRLFTALRNNYNNQGKVIKGKLIKPIKSCLNYAKALMYPMKLEYQKETFNVIMSETATSKKFDSYMCEEMLKANASRSQNRGSFLYIMSALNNSTKLLDQLLEKSPFKQGTPEYTYLKVSLLLNALKSLKTRHKLDSDPSTIILWKLPKSMNNYVAIILKEFYIKLKQDIIESANCTTISDDLLSKMIKPDLGDMIDYED